MVKKELGASDMSGEAKAPVSQTTPSTEAAAPSIRQQPIRAPFGPPAHNGTESFAAKTRKPSTAGLYDTTIWSNNGMSAGFSTEHKPKVRGAQKQSTGSALLLDDSVSDSLWVRSNDASKSHGAVAPAARGKLGEVISPMGNGNASSVFNGTNGHQSRASFSTQFGNNNLSDHDQQTSTFQRNETSMHNGFGRMHSAHPSPSDERRNWISNNGLPNVAGPRDASLPPSSRDGDLQLTTTNNSLTNGFRRGSTPHALANPSPDAMGRAVMQLGNLSLNSPAHSNGYSHHVHRVPSVPNVDSTVFAARRPSRQLDLGDVQTYQGMAGNSEANSGSYMNGSTSMTPVSGNTYAPQVSPLGRALNSRPPSLNSFHDPRRDSAQSYPMSSPYPPMNPSQFGFNGPVPGFDAPRQPFGMTQYGQQYNQQFSMQQNIMANSPYAAAGYTPPGQPHGMGGQSGVLRRSQVLEEFKQSGSKHSGRRFELKDTFGHIVEFSGDQFGSRFIQAKIETCSAEEKSMVFQEIMPNCMQLMTDIFGNYVIQKLFEHGDQYQKRMLGSQMRGRVVSLSMQMYGCRVVQKALEVVLVDQQSELIAEFSVENVIRCVKDQNGNHVIQRIIECCSPPVIRPIIEAFEGHIMNLSQHAYGCRVIQRVLEFCEPSEKDFIMRELRGGMASLVADQYGNYVVQHVVSHARDSDRALALSIVMANLDFFCKHKFASNVVETCIEFGGPEFHGQMLDRFVAPRRNQETMLCGLIKDGYGNYVVQKLLELLTLNDYRRLLENLRPELAKLRKMTCQKQIQSIEKRMLRERDGKLRPFNSRANSDDNTPALTYTSVQSSAISSVNGDSDGTTPTRKH